MFIEKNKIKIDNNVEFVSVTDSCFGAETLKRFDLREKAYPFDWNIVPKSIILEFFNEKLNYKMDKNDLVFYPKQKTIVVNNTKTRTKLDINGTTYYTSKMMHPVINKKKFKIYVHDFPDKEVNTVIEKYTKRFNRLKELLENSNKTIIFITQSHNHDIKTYLRENNINDVEYDEKLDVQQFINKFKVILKKNYPNLNYSIIDYKNDKKIFKRFSAYKKKK